MGDAMESTKILIYVNYPGSNESRAGMHDRQKEIDLTKDAFTKLGYGSSLHTFFDWTSETLNEDVMKQKELTTSCEQLICLFMCHGEEGILYDVEKTPIPYSHIIPKIASIAPNSKKAFIFQCCRGEHYLNEDFVKTKCPVTNGSTDAKRDITGDVEARQGAGQNNRRKWKKVLQQKECQNMVILMSTLAEMVSVRAHCIPLLAEILCELKREFDKGQAQKGYDWFEDVFLQLSQRMRRKDAPIRSQIGPTIMAKQVALFISNMGDDYNLKAQKVEIREEPEPEPSYSQKLETLAYGQQEY